MKELWKEIGDNLLCAAQEVLKKDTVPSEKSLDTVSKLLDLAIRIDLLNLQREAQNRYGAAVYPGQPFLRQSSKN